MDDERGLSGWGFSGRSQAAVVRRQSNIVGEILYRGFIVMETNPAGRDGGPVCREKIIIRT